jgi:hypothetical protein
MKRLLAGVFGLGLIAVAAAQTGQSTNTDALPPVQPPPDMDVNAAPADTPPADATASPAKAAAAKAAPVNVTTRAAPIVPLANSDEEAKAAATAETKATAERAKALTAPPVPQLPGGKPLESPGLPADVQKAAEATELPVVTVRQNGNERVEEYRKKGILYFVRVVPPEGPPRYYVDRRSDIPPDISQLSAPSGHVEPVYFKLFEWK